MVWRGSWVLLVTVPDPVVGGTRKYLLPCPTALASLGCQRCGTAEGLWEAFPRGLQRHREAGCSSARGTQINSIHHQLQQGVRLPRQVYRGLFTVYSPFAMEKLRKKGQLGSPVSMQKRGSPRYWAPCPPSPPGILDVPLQLHQNPSLPILGPVSCCHLVWQESAQVPASLTVALRLESKQMILWESERHKPGSSSASFNPNPCCQ